MESKVKKERKKRKDNYIYEMSTEADRQIASTSPTWITIAAGRIMRANQNISSTVTVHKTNQSEHAIYLGLEISGRKPSSWLRQVEDKIW